MSGSTACHSLAEVAAIIPALDEAQNLMRLLPLLRPFALGQTLVCDNGSTDATRQVVDRNGAQWVCEPQRGYGAACFAGLVHLQDSIRVVVFLDADQGTDVSLLPKLVNPILQDECDLVIGVRTPHLCEPGATSRLQRLGNWLMPALIRWGWHYSYSDMGPFRAVRRSSLDAINMQDRAYGWTLEMQIRAVELGLRMAEVPVPHRRRRRGQSKISGSFRGALRAGFSILRTGVAFWLTKRRRLRAR